MNPVAACIVIAWSAFTVGFVAGSWWTATLRPARYLRRGFYVVHQDGDTPRRLHLHPGPDGRDRVMPEDGQ